MMRMETFEKTAEDGKGDVHDQKTNKRKENKRKGREKEEKRNEMGEK